MNKHIMKLILILFFACTIIDSKAQQKLGKESIIDKSNYAVFIDSLNILNASFFWYDKFDDEKTFRQFGPRYMKTQGRKNVIENSNPTLIILPIGNQLPFLIFPQDTIVVYTSKHKLLYGGIGVPSLKHISDTMRNDELIFFQELFDSLGVCYGLNSYFTPGHIKNLREAASYHFVKYEKRINFLNRRQNKNLLSQRFYHYAKNFFIFKLYDDILNSLGSRKFSDTSTKQIAVKIADSLAQLLNNESGYFFYSWYDAIKNYVEFRIKLWGDSDMEFDKELQHIEENLKGSAKNFAVFYLYKNIINRNPDQVKSRLHLLEQYCKDKDYINYISGHTAFTKRKTGDGIRENLLSYNGEIKKLTSLINSFRGKILYIDFWASWCLPCIEEIPFSKKLIEEFKSKNVVFLFISKDSYSERWKKSINRYDMKDKGIHYLILDGEENYFVKKYNINSIPRYILIDKNGFVVNSDAPRPSEEKTRELINRLLKE